MIWNLLLWPFLMVPFSRPPLPRPAVVKAQRLRPLAVASPVPPRPLLSADSYLVIDYNSGQWLASKQPDKKLLPASLTKMVTALVSLNYFPLDEWLTVYRDYPVGQTAELKEGSKLKVRDLISLMLIHSANDAAFVLADNYRRQTGHSLVAAMNSWLKEHRFESTHFANFDGEEDKGHYSTAADMAKIARILLENKFLAFTVRQPAVTVYDNKGQKYSFNATDELLKEPGYYGIKTGWTTKAGGCFVSLYRYQKHKLIGVVLHSQDRFADTQRLLKAVAADYRWRSIEFNY